MVASSVSAARISARRSSLKNNHIHVADVSSKSLPPDMVVDDEDIDSNSDTDAIFTSGSLERRIEWVFLCLGAPSIKLYCVIYVRTPSVSKIMPSRRARFEARTRTRNLVVRKNSGTESNVESSAESSEYVGEVKYTYTRRVKAKPRVREKSWKTRNWRKPPSRNRVAVNARSGIEGTEDVACPIESHKDNDYGKEGQDPVILHAQDQLVDSTSNLEQRAPPSHSRTSAVTDLPKPDSSSNLPLGDAFELPVQYQHPEADKEHGEGYSTSHLVESNGDGIDTGLEDEAVEAPASPADKLIVALESLMLPSLRMQQAGHLPFLLRNLRPGFADRCRLLGMPTKSATHSDEPLEVRLIFRLQTSETVYHEDGGFSDVYRTHMTSWNCPFCDLHGSLGTQIMLQKHIEWDHSEIKTRWTHDKRVCASCPHCSFTDVSSLRI